MTFPALPFLFAHWAFVDIGNGQTSLTSVVDANCYLSVKKYL